jgi:hypothetical protein
MLHVYVAQSCMIEEEFLLGGGEILIGIGERFHVENFREVVRGTRRACAIRAATSIWSFVGNTGDEVRDGISRGDGNMESTDVTFSILDVKPHAFIIAAKARIGTRPSVIASIGLGRHETLFSRGDIVCWHTKCTLAVLGVNHSPFDYTEPCNGDDSLYGAHMSKIAGDGFKDEVPFAESNSDATSGVETDGEEVGIVGNVLMGDDANSSGSASLEAARFEFGKA